MCGRYSLSLDIEELERAFRVPYTLEKHYLENFNVSPGSVTPVLAVDPKTQKLAFMPMKWGLIPNWAESDQLSYKTINARFESIGEKATFRQAYYQRRCLVIADSFYEWKPTDASRVPYRVAVDDKIMVFAGIWDFWVSPKTQEVLYSFAVVTADAQGEIADIHHRMPIILNLEMQRHWISPGSPSEKITQYLKTYHSQFKVNAVNKKVNSSSFNGPEAHLDYEEEVQAQGQLGF